MGGNYSQPDFEAPRIPDAPDYEPGDPDKKAAGLGRIITYPSDNELFIDIDNHADLMIFARRWDAFRKYFPCAEECRTPSPSGREHHFHIRVVLGPAVHLTPTERILYQALLGSDMQRELLCARELADGDESTTLFFEKDDLDSTAGRTPPNETQQIPGNPREHIRNPSEDVSVRTATRTVAETSSEPTNICSRTAAR